MEYGGGIWWNIWWTNGGIWWNMVEYGGIWVEYGG